MLPLSKWEMATCGGHNPWAPDWLSPIFVLADHHVSSTPSFYFSAPLPVGSYWYQQTMLFFCGKFGAVYNQSLAYTPLQDGNLGFAGPEPAMVCLLRESVLVVGDSWAH